jgi:hypothetical protein
MSLSSGLFARSLLVVKLISLISLIASISWRETMYPSPVELSPPVHVLILRHGGQELWWVGVLLGCGEGKIVEKLRLAIKSTIRILEFRESQASEASTFRD